MFVVAWPSEVKKIPDKAKSKLITADILKAMIGPLH
jgi:hypothetical protein